MKYTISSLSFDWGRVKRLADMPEQLGYEIFWECGSEDNWHNSMRILRTDRCGRRLSIHAPYFFVDLSLPGDENKMFKELMRPFDFYHKYNAEFYVVHTFDHMTYPHDEAFEAECRQRSIDRLGKFDEICRREGVLMAAENIAFGNGEPYLFNHRQYLNIFEQLPELHCLIDLGHAALTDIDVYELQRNLKDRIVGYHLHDNDGKSDSHKKMFSGIRDWETFAKGVAEFTPDAAGVLEYYGHPDLQTYIRDISALESMIENAKT